MTAPTPASAADTLTDFTPGTLAKLPVPPVFRFRSCGRREREQFSYMAMAEGYKFHGKAAFRDVVREGLRAGWDDAETYEREVSRVEAYWRATDDHETATEGAAKKPAFKFDQAEEQAIHALITETADFHAPLRKMIADNITYQTVSPSIIAAIVVRGWRDFDLSFGLQGGYLSLDRVELVEDKLGEIEDQARKDGVAGIETTGTAFLELCAAAATHLFPAKEAPADAPASTEKPKSTRAATPAPAKD